MHGTSIMPPVRARGPRSLRPPGRGPEWSSAGPRQLVTTELAAPLTTPAPPDARARSNRRRLVVAVLVLTALLRLPAFFVDVFNSDETFLATQAQVIRNGGSLYEDATDRKPPLVPYLYAATFATVGSTALWSVRVAALLAFAPQDGQAANFEVFMLPAMTASFLLAARGRPRGSGFAVAVATLAKQTGAATLIPVLYLAWKKGGRRGVTTTLAAFAIPLAIVALLVGPGDLLFWAATGNGSYFGLGSATVYVAGLFAVMT